MIITLNPAHTLEFRPFRADDWYGYAGATSFHPGEPPLLGMETVEIVNELGNRLGYFEVILDKEAIQFINCRADGYITEVSLPMLKMLASWTVAVPPTQEHARFIYKQLFPYQQLPIRITLLMALGALVHYRAP